ncbi:VOC family protein, partial [Enterococcus sp. S181_ASV_20]|nr:VOC family protein [Enterococcus sp. S181_ASV_20]
MCIRDSLGEAADFYSSTFEDSRIVNQTHFITDEHGEIGDLLTITLELAGCEFLLLNGGDDFSPSPAISYVVNLSLIHISEP